MNEMTLAVYAAKKDREAQWVKQLEGHVKALGVPVTVFAGTNQTHLANLVFVDAEVPDLKKTLFRLNRRGNAVFLVLGENDKVPENLESIYVDDVIVAPFRMAEIESKIRFFKQMVLWDEVTELNARLSDVLKHFQSDIQLASRIHEFKMPKRFPKVKGLEISHRYLAGLKPGGDHFDIAETTDGSCLSLVYFHSSSYGLSGAILTILMKAAVKLSQNRMGIPGTASEIVSSVYEEILLTMNPRDRVSLFFGIYGRKDQTLRFVNLGDACVAFGEPGADLKSIAPQAPSIAKNVHLPPFTEGQLKMGPGCRFGLFSEGFINSAQGMGSLMKLLNHARMQEPVASLNELAFRVKSSLMAEKGEDETELPPQDCTGVIIDVGRAIVQLAPREGSR